MEDDLSKVAEDSARGGFFLIFGSIAVELISAIASILVANFLGSELYGQYALAIVVPQLLFLFADIGINQGLIKFSASLRAEGKPEKIAKLIKYGMLFKAFTGMLIFIVNFAFADYFAAFLLNRPTIGLYIRIASVAVFFQAVFATATSAFVGLDKTHYNALTTNVQAVAKAVISLMLVIFGFSVMGAVVGYVAGFLVAGVASVCILLFILRKELQSADKTDFTQNVKTLVGFGIPLYISALLAGFVLPYENIILSIFTSDAQIGNFKAAQNFVTLIQVFSLPITTALLPAFSKLNSTSNGKINDFFKLANKYTALLILPVTFMLIAFSKEIVQLIYQSTYTSAGLFLAVYCALYLLVGIGFLSLSSLFNGLGETRMTLKINLITVVIFVGLAPVLASVYGVPGSIAAIFISNAISTLYGFLKARAKFKVQLATRSLVKIYVIAAISCIPGVLLLRFSTLPLILKVGIAGAAYLLAYATLIPLTKVITRYELEKAERILQRISILRYAARPFVRYQKIIMAKFQRLIG